MHAAIVVVTLSSMAITVVVIDLKSDWWRLKAASSSAKFAVCVIVVRVCVVPTVVSSDGRLILDGIGGKSSVVYFW